MKTIERWIGYVFLATIAWQTRIILWHDGLWFSEWTSVAIWFSDGLMLALLVAAVIQGWRPRIREQSDWLLLAFFGTATLSLTQAILPVIGWYQLARLAWFILFFLYLRQWAFPRLNPVNSALAFVGGALGQAALAIAQFTVQHDVGLRWMGETLLRTDMQGVAVFFDTAGEKILRAYGTLPHPNVLAAYLMVAFWLLLWLWVRHAIQNVYQKSMLIGVSSFLIFGILVTFSRTVILVWLISVVLFAGAIFLPTISRRWPNITAVRSRLRLSMGTIAIAVLVFGGLFWPQVHARLTVHTTDEAVQLRIAFTRNALATGQNWLLRVNWLGVGIGNFTPWLSAYNRTLPAYLIQPAHNIYLLLYSETGVLGLGLWLAWLILLLCRGWRAHANQPVMRAGLTALVLSLLLIAVNDHFPWTLQQGRLLFWATLALL